MKFEGGRLPVSEEQAAPETQTETQEGILVPAQALEAEKGILQKFEKTGGSKMKRVIASLLLGSALVFGAGAFEASAAEPSKAQQWVEDVGKKSSQAVEDLSKKNMQEIGRLQNSYQEEARKIWEKFAEEVERIKKEGASLEHVSREVATPRILEIIKGMKAYPSKNPVQKMLMEEEFVKTWLFIHAEITKNIDTRGEDRVSRRDAQESADALNRALMRSFDTNNDEVLDRAEIAAYEETVKNNQGLSILRGIKLFEQRGAPPAR